MTPFSVLVYLTSMIAATLPFVVGVLWRGLEVMKSAPAVALMSVGSLTLMLVTLVLLDLVRFSSRESHNFKK